MKTPWAIIAGLVGLAGLLPEALAQGTNAVELPLTAPGLPQAGGSLLRVAGALALVLGLFLGGVWMYRNWQRLGFQQHSAPKLQVVEVRPLGGKHALYVVGYEQERFLLAASPNGVNLLAPLPAAGGSEAAAETAPSSPPSFTEALRLVLRRK